MSTQIKRPHLLQVESETAGQPVSFQGQPPHTLFGMLVSEVGRRSDITFADLLAEPVEGEASGRIDWYGPAESRSARPWSALNDEERRDATENLRISVERLKSCRDPAESAFNRILDASLNVPSLDDIMVFDGGVVLVRWGMVPSAEPAASPLIDQILAGDATIQTNELSDAEETMQLDDGRFVGSSLALPVTLLSILLTILLLTAAGLLTLRNCGVAVPSVFTGDRIVYLANFCSHAEDLYDPKLDYLSRLERAVADRAIDCPPLREDDIQDPDREVSEEAVQEREQEHGVEAGKLSITLAWNGSADLDLHVICPTGERISHGRKMACGGELQLDMNTGPNKSTTPIENIFWRIGEVPSGRYHVHVACYNTQPDCDQGVSYTVEVKGFGGRVSASYNGVATVKFHRSSSGEVSSDTSAGSFDVP